MVTQENDGMRGEDSDGIQPAGQHLYIRDQARFMKQIPNLIATFRMSRPENAWKLDLSPTSLDLVDTYIAEAIDKILRQQMSVSDAIDAEFVKQLVAYVGEVIVRNKNGQWMKNVRSGATGPLVVFHLQWTRTDGTVGERDKALDVYEHGVRTVLEGESIARWYEQERT